MKWSPVQHHRGHGPRSMLKLLAAALFWRPERRIKANHDYHTVSGSHAPWQSHAANVIAYQEDRQINKLK